MSRQTLPLLFLNLSGEMMYIFDQRLRAQEVPEEKSTKALHELLANILDENLTSELFKFQDMYTVQVLFSISRPFNSFQLRDNING